VFAGSRGGTTRARIVQALMERPLNTNQLAVLLGIDYTTVAHHLRVLEQNALVTGLGPRYGRTYFVTDKMTEFAPAFQAILEKLQGKPGG
jgi:DNA-binding transcriptional ArsR family regulator